MKKYLVVLLSVLYLGAASGPLWAQTPSTSKTPVVKSKTAKKTGKKMKKKKAKAAKSASTPTAK